mmetsp:Transcript_18774/g.55059  ORF Transcript_18774/g.55059 Transcript_18774/m.55059 type:complete len:105 (+) Transcript_18774:396-710(+)
MNADDGHGHEVNAAAPSPRPATPARTDLESARARTPKRQRTSSAGMGYVAVYDDNDDDAAKAALEKLRKEMAGAHKLHLASADEYTRKDGEVVKTHQCYFHSKT